MESLKNLIRFLLIAGTGPAIVSLLTLICAVLYWGPGASILLMVVLMAIVGGFVSLILTAIFQKRSVLSRMLITSSFVLVLAISLASMQMVNTVPNNLKVAVLTPELDDKFNAKRGAIQYMGGEHEVFVELSSTPELTQLFLASRPYELLEKSTTYQFPHGPGWFPHQIHPNYLMYLCESHETEEVFYAFISADANTIYAYYLNF